MSTLTTTNSGFVPATAKATPVSTRKPLWRTLYDAMIASRERRAEREIAAYIEGHGGLLNDQMEREIMLRLSGRRGNRPS